MNEINRDNANFLIKKKDSHIIFVNSPFCGTCKVAKRMLEYVEEALEEEKFYELNATLAPDILQKYNIMSVPCLIVFKNGRPVDRMYAFRSVPHVLKEMSPYLV
ncbi:thioredoxin [Halalkalibacillus sediminis]|uniref:Thioredoxin n=1 Tax=Halalkalibacillus sediminis TaxID=2018042 RepID=A0A2I0QUP7_9BACI|nr:thioredoxin family protein [Halalkalibacillus sediminis]PKR78071.1 thioredoxin [Halalkalibacillus sediminis]